MAQLRLKSVNCIGTSVRTATRRGIEITELKVRYSNELEARIKHLERVGHTEINIIELPYSMTKVEALEYLLSTDFQNDNETARQEIQNELVRQQINELADEAERRSRLAKDYV